MTWCWCQLKYFSAVADDKPVSKNSDEFKQMFLIGHKVCSAYAEKTGKPAPVCIRVSARCMCWC